MASPYERGSSGGSAYERSSGSGSAYARSSRTTAPKKADGGGVLGFIARGAADIPHLARGAAGGIVHAADATYREAKQHLSPVPPKNIGKQHSPLLDEVIVPAAKQTVEDFRHPQYWDRMALDALGLVNPAAGAVGRVTRAGRAAAAGEAGAAAKTLVTRGPVPKPRLISHDGQTVKIPASAAPVNRLMQKGVDRLRERFPSVPVFGAASVVGKESARALRYEGEVAKAPIRALVSQAKAAGMFKRGKNGRITQDALARQHALRVVAEEVPVPERVQFHQGLLDGGFKVSARKNPEIARMKEREFTQGHQEQVRLNQASDKYLSHVTLHDGTVVPRLADPKLATVYDQLLKVAGGREKILEELGKLDEFTKQGRYSSAGRVLKGAKFTTKETVPPDTELVALRQGYVDQAERAARHARAQIEGRIPRSFAPGIAEHDLASAERRLVDAKRLLAEASQPTVLHGDAALRGAEDFTGGEARIPTVPAYKRPKSTKVTAGTSGGVAAVKDLATVTHPYTGAAYRGGKIRTDVIRLMAESALEAQKHWTLLHVTDRLKEAAKDAPTSKWDIPIITERLPDQPSLAAIRARMEEAPIDNKVVGALSHTYEALRQRVFPDFHRDQFGVPQTLEPIPGVKYVDSRLLGGLNEKNPLLGWYDNRYLKGVLTVADAVNNASKIAILYLKPAYAVPNLLGNVALNLTQQGFAYPLNLRDAAKLWAGADKETAQSVLSAMGEGIGGSLEGAGFLSGATQKLSGKWSAVVDSIPRLTSFLHEARREGIKTPEQLRDLFKNPEMKDTLEQITRRANQEIIDYGNLGPVQQSIIRRVIFFYPWVKGATVWSVHFVAEHPAQAAVAGQLGQIGMNDRDKALGSMIPSWAESLVPTGTGPHGLPETINLSGISALQTPADVLTAITHPSEAANLLQMLTPALGAAVQAVTPGQGLKAAGQGLVSNLPGVVAAERALGAKPSKTFPYANNWQTGLLQFLLGSGLIPRETDPGALQRSWQYEHKK